MDKLRTNYTIDPMLELEMDFSPAFTHWGQKATHRAGTQPNNCSICSVMGTSLEPARHVAERARIQALMARDYEAWLIWRATELRYGNQGFERVVEEFTHRLALLGPVPGCKKRRNP